MNAVTAVKRDDSMDLSPQALIELLRSLAPQIRELGAQAEIDRRLPSALVDLLADTGIFSIMMPKGLGGLGYDMIDVLDVIEELSSIDGAAGWCLLKVATTNSISANLEPDTARKIWANRRIAAAGSIAPKARAVKVDGGFRVSGRFDWGTATSFSDWMIGGAFVVEEGKPPVPGPNGFPEVRQCFFPKSDVQLIDTWNTYGMRGTASGDFVVENVFVPNEFAMSHHPTSHWPDYSLTKIPSSAQVPVPHASVSLGIARASIDALIELATAKTPLMSRTLLKDKDWVQDSIGRASAMVNAARAYVREAVRALEAAVANGTLTPQIEMGPSLAATHAAHVCIDAVALMLRASGGSGVHNSCAIQRHFRDVNVASTHFLVNVEKFAGAGRVLIGDAKAVFGH
jgi:indole-3-acetate monooxygenase